MGGWAGFWIFCAMLLVFEGWHPRVDCAVGVKAACDKLAAYYATPSTEPRRD